MNIGSKVRAIRESLRLTRTEFAEHTGIAMGAIEGIEKTGRSPSYEKVESICKSFPYYTLWLMIDEPNPSAGQISPEQVVFLRDYLAEQGKELAPDLLIEATALLMELDEENEDKTTGINEILNKVSNG